MMSLNKRIFTLSIAAGLVGVSLSAEAGPDFKERWAQTDEDWDRGYEREDRQAKRAERRRQTDPRRPAFAREDRGGRDREDRRGWSRRDDDAADRPFRFGRTVDENRDGRITRREMRRFHRSQAQKSAWRLDRDRDGWLSRDEVLAQRRFQAYPADLDGNGWVSPAERTAFRRAKRFGMPVRELFRLKRREARERFAWLDRDGNGVIGRWELARIRAGYRGY